jgi:drug/metabolite transporter (DMT)-like permease
MPNTGFTPQIDSGGVCPNTNAATAPKQEAQISSSAWGNFFTSKRIVESRSALQWKTPAFLVVAVVTNSFGNLLLAIGMDRMPSFVGTPFPHYLYLLIANPYMIPGTALSAAYMVAQLSLFSWADLSFVVPVIASSYVLTTLLSEFVLGEHVQVERWMGVLLICAGVAFVMRTPTDTKSGGR